MRLSLAQSSHGLLPWLAPEEPPARPPAAAAVAPVATVTANPLAITLITAAAYEAELLGHAETGAEHFLLAIIRHGRSGAGAVLASVGVGDLGAVRRRDPGRTHRPRRVSASRWGGELRRPRLVRSRNRVRGYRRASQRV